MTPTVPSPIKSRILAAIRGAFVADAASMGTHWTYDPKEMATKVPSRDEPEFKDPPAPSFYSSDEFPGHYESGMLSPYGEQMLFVTDYVANSNDDDGIGGEEMSEKMLQWAETFGGRPDSALKDFIQNMKKEDGSGKWPNCGADDYQAHIYMKIVPVTCLYAGKSQLVEKVKEAIRVHQNNEQAVSFGIAAARILEGVLLGGKLDEVLSTCQENLANDDLPDPQAVMDAFQRAKALLSDHADLDAVLLTLSHELMKDQKDSPFYDLFGRSCALPGSFVGPLYLFYKASEGKLCAEENGWYTAALRENILGAGDTCSRAIFVGAVLAAATETVPEGWIAKVHSATYGTVDAAAQSIADKAENA